MLPQAMLFYLGGEVVPAGPPYCVHVGEVGAPLAAGQVTAAGLAPPPDAGSLVLVIGQVYSPGWAAGEIGSGTAVDAGAVYTPGPDAGQFACEDD